MQVTLPIDVVIKSVRKRKEVYDKAEEDFVKEMILVRDTFYSYSFILKSKESMEQFLETKLDNKILVERCFQNSFITQLAFPFYSIGRWLGYEFYVMLPIILNHEPERKVKHTKLYSNKLKELQELKRLGATEVTLTPEDEKFLDLTIDSL